jgi:hypothetical protein
MLPIAVLVVALAGYVYALGWVLDVVRFTAGGLPALTAADQLSSGQVFGYGIGSACLMVAVLLVGGGLAYFSSARKWDVNRHEWHDIVNRGVGQASADSDAKAQRQLRERRHWQSLATRAGRRKHRLRRRGHRRPAALAAALQRLALHRAQTWPAGKPDPHLPAPLGDWAVRLVAGFNIMVLAGLIAIGAARWIGPLLQVGPWQTLAQWLGVAVGIAVFLLARWLLTTVSPARHPWLHRLTWGLVAAGTLFASIPVGVAVLIGVALSTFGRPLAKVRQPRTPSQFARSPLPWVLLALCTLLGVAYSAMAPVVFPVVVVTTPTGELTGGYVSRQDAGVYLVTCTGLADATATDVRLQLVPSGSISGVRIAGVPDYLDSGQRPSLGRLALQALGLGADPPTLFSAALRARRPTCAGTGAATVSIGTADPRLGAGVIAGPPNPPARAGDGEPPVQADGRTPPQITALARRYQPSVLVTAADRNWPVSVNAVLAERGPQGQQACLRRAGSAPVCPPAARDLGATGAQSSDYLQLPVTLGSNRDPRGQFDAFLRGQYESSGTLHQWLADPGRLDPWYSAQIYFYYAGPVASSQWPAKAVDPNVPSNLIGLEYWFYYPFNYYPVVVDSGLMVQAPIAGDQANVDLHQGDWEHVDVLLNPATDKPEWLYMARHDYEGRFIPWSSPSLRFDAGHPVIQAAFGGHPSYLPGCEAGPRVAALEATSDWLSCGSGRFAFRAQTTPLVNVAQQPWACWPGHFGEATSLEVKNSAPSEPVIDTVQHLLYVAGPSAPLLQAENRGVACPRGPETAELTAPRRRAR